MNDDLQELRKHFEKESGLNRRDFLKTAGVIGAGAALSATGLGSLTGCGYDSDWKPVSFPKVVLHNFRLFDGIGNKLQEGLILLIEGDSIKAIEKSGDLAQFKEYKIIDLKGATLLPGLIDNHVHITVPFMYSVNLNFMRQINQQIVSNFRYCVMKGVTTVRDVGAIPGKLLKFRKLCDENEIPGPRVISSLSPIAARKGDKLGAPEKAPYFTNPVILWLVGGNYAERPETVEEIRECCERMIGLGAQWMKTLYQEHSYSYNPRPLPNHSDEGYRLILQIGKDHGLKSALHQPFLNGFRKGVQLGFHTLEHIPLDGIIPDGEIEKFMKKGMAIMPTIMAFGDDLIQDKLLELVEMKGKEFLVPEAIKQMSKRMKDLLDQSKKKLTAEERKEVQFDHQFGIEMFPHAIQNLQKLHRMGATVGMGTDIGGTPTGFFGRFVDELRHYVSAGISNFEALRIATAVNAKIIDMQDKIGTVEKGKFADLIAVTGDPLKDINALDSIAMVMKGGIFMNSEGIDLG